MSEKREIEAGGCLAAAMGSIVGSLFIIAVSVLAIAMKLS